MTCTRVLNISFKCLTLCCFFYSIDEKVKYEEVNRIHSCYVAKVRQNSDVRWKGSHFTHMIYFKLKKYSS